MKKRVVIVHGYGGAPEGCWKPWLKKELEAQGFDVSVPLMPDTDYPKLSPWLAKLNEVIGNPDENLFLIGHSLGTPTILQYLSRLSEGVKIGGTIFVAGLPSFPEIKDDVGEFFAEEKIKQAKNHCDKFAVIYSNGDEHVSIERAKQFSQNLEAQEIFIQDKGHFSDDDQVFELPEALEVILGMSK